MSDNDDFQNLKEDLQERKKQNMHFLFFQKDPKISSIKVPIIKNHDPNIILNPFRNIKCLHPSCVYDLNELLQLFLSTKNKQNPNFICNNCQSLISFSSFFCDLTLKSLIEKIWLKYNKPNQIICHTVKILRTGTCKPIISEYLKLMEKNYVNNFVNKKGENAEQKLIENDDFFFKIPAFQQNNEAALKFSEKYGIFPKLSDFSQNDFKKYEEELKFCNRKMNEILLERYGNVLFIRDFQNLRDESAFPISLMSIFLMYMQDLQKNDPETYNYEKGNRGLFLGYRMKKYDSFYKTLDCEIFFGMKNEYFNNPHTIYSNFDLIFVVILIEERFFLCIIQLKKQFLTIIDFLDRDLDTIQQEDVSEISKIISQKELSLKKLQISFYEKKKFNKYNDFGLYVTLFIYKTLRKPFVDDVRVKTNDKDLFKNCLL